MPKMENVIYDVGNEFHHRPMGRKKTDGEFSGEAFREKVLYPFFSNLINQKSDQILVLDFNNVSMAGSSFLEEAFGGLVRAGIKKELIQSHLKILVDIELKELIEDRIFQYIKRA
ncbi:STAS-like domain-containing protein [Acinetobacter johnsonii]|uniref:STAS-like domain-containing protein n=2 Tax=Acinetobacter johnsonii TaxID=40214 RepID=A0A7T2RSG5_ACIJO|nr:STAS-like domain-containing protein [Acinetobacter johnsonii]